MTNDHQMKVFSIQLLSVMSQIQMKLMAMSEVYNTMAHSEMSYPDESELKFNQVNSAQS
jgi:hypothetical protein